MNKKGFTMVEILATITILAIIATIAGVSYNGIKKSYNTNLCKQKITNIENIVAEYAENNNIFENYDDSEECTNNFNACMSKWNESFDKCYETMEKNPSTNLSDRKSYCTTYLELSYDPSYCIAKSEETCIETYRFNKNRCKKYGTVVTYYACYNSNTKKYNYYVDPTTYEEDLTEVNKCANKKLKKFQITNFCETATNYSTNYNNCYSENQCMDSSALSDHQITMTLEYLVEQNVLTIDEIENPLSGSYNGVVKIIKRTSGLYEAYYEGENNEQECE